MSKTKLLILAVLISSFLGYLSLSGDQGEFLFQFEFNLIFKTTNAEWVFLFPITVLTLIGQAMLLINLFFMRPKLFLILMGISGIAMIFILLLFVGIFDKNHLMILFSLPFFVLSFILIKHMYRIKNVKP